jgi:hypothetical protein
VEVQTTNSKTGYVYDVIVLEQHRHESVMGGSVPWPRSSPHCLSPTTECVLPESRRPRQTTAAPYLSPTWGNKQIASSGT